MRFKQGDKVEVMNKKDVPFSWRIAEILSANGHSFCVQYDSFPGMSRELMVETVSRKFVRPCPPLDQGIAICVTGDIVEVFYEFSWKIAAIVKNMDCKRENISNKIHFQASAFQNQYLVRLIGCSKELIIEGSNIRLRQAWHDEKWILMGKNSQRCEDTRAIKPSTSNCCQNMNFQMPLSNAIAKNLPQKDCVISSAAFWESPVISSRSLKRISPHGSSIMETHDGHVHKLRAVEKDGRKQRMVAACVHEKGQSWRHASFASKDLTMMPGFASGIYYWMISRLLSDRHTNLWPLPGITHFNLCNYITSSDLSYCSSGGRNKARCQRAVSTRFPFSFSLGTV